MSNRRTVAMVVNDDAGSLNASVVWATIVGTPPGACSLLQGGGEFYFRYHPHG